MFCLVSTASGQHFSHFGQLLVSFWFCQQSAVLQVKVSVLARHVDVMIITQITNSVVCDMSKGSPYNKIKLPLVACFSTDQVCLLDGSHYKWWQQWDTVNCQTGSALSMYRRPFFRLETSR